MNTYADDQRALNPLQYEKSRLVIDAVTELKIALEDGGLTISDLARLVGRGRAIVSRQLAGHENLTLGKLAELSWHLGKRFEIQLADITPRQIHVAALSVVRLTWPQQQRGTLRVSAPAPEDIAATKHATAA